MSRRRTAVSFIFAAAFFLFAARQDVQAKTVNFKDTISGSSTSTAFSFDGTDLAGLVIGAGKQDPGGTITVQGVHQDKPDGKTCTVAGGAPNAGTEFTLIGDSDVIRFQPSGDLLYAHETAATTCIDFSSGTPPFPLVGNSSAVITGGTGKYAGATGTNTSSVTGVILSLPGGVSGAGPGFGFFTSFETNGSGTITTP